MLRRMIVKEWKEKNGLVVFALAVFVLFSVAFFVYAKDPETLDLLTSTLLLVFPSVFALLVGASGFTSEFQDGAWAYLFSRPVKKWKVWLAKYVSLLTILYTAILFLAFLLRFHPALEPARSSFQLSLVGDRSYNLFMLVLPLLLFTASFSLSVVSDRSFSVLFVAAAIFFALSATASIVLEPLFFRRMLSLPFSLLSVALALIPFSFVMASLITLNKADFSQPKSRAWVFTKSAAAGFLLLLILISLVVFGAVKSRSERSVRSIAAHADAFYFATDRGIFNFDIASGDTKRIARIRPLWSGISLGGNEIAFVTYRLSYRLRGKWRGFAELRIMNEDGSAEKTLVGTDDQKSPLYGGHIYPVCVSPQGDKVAFIASSTPKTTAEELWLINSDGTGLRGYGLGMENARYYISIAFSDSGQSLYTLFTPRIETGKNDQRPGLSLIRTALDSGMTELIAEGIRRPDLSLLQGAGRIPGKDQIVYIAHDEAQSKDILTVLDPGNLEKRRVQLEDSVIAFRSNKDGDRLAFLTSGSDLGVYSLPEQNVVWIREVKSDELRWPWAAFEWTADGRLILRKSEGEAPSICLLDADLKEQQAIRLPFTTYYPGPVWSAGNYVVVEYTARHQLWMVDLTTEKWLRIY